MRPKLLEVRDLKKHFRGRSGFFRRAGNPVRAVDGVSFELLEGETLGLVGESGCGKTTAGRTILRLTEPTGGSVHFEGHRVFDLGKRELRRLRRRMQIVFQDPYSALNPRLTVGATLGEAFRIHRLARGPEIPERVADLLGAVGLQPDHARRYPHQFSGGQRQRIGIARALAVNPRLIVADEPVSALDVSVQAQIVNLMQDLQEKWGLTYLFIAHDLNVVRHISDRIAVMYLGRIVELADSDALHEDPQHPYTRALLSSVPTSRPGLRRSQVVLSGDVPNPANVPPGCPFHPRCPERTDGCDRIVPELLEIDPGRRVSCHLRTGEAS